MAQESRYRPDIDGMRAIAVLLVIFYHAGFDIVPGGFIGVDIFFVLSGYLITGIVVRDLASDRFSFRRFYMRRIKRLLPAFYTVVIATGAVGIFVFLPNELEDFAASALSALFFSSNFYFGSVTEGYFAPEVDSLPLLHTWSLAVEEQFYFIWPLSLMLLRKSLDHRRLMYSMGLLAIASFVSAEIAVRSLSDSVYFALWSRAGELLIGALLALHHFGSEPADSRLPRVFETLLTAIGFGLIAGPALWLDDASFFPGLNALWPCLGVAILIHVGRREGAISHVILTIPPLVWTGLLSYALYLWHWPLFVLARNLRLDIDTHLAWILIALSFGLSIFSWRFIERPIRYRARVSFRVAFVGIFALPALGIAALCLFAITTQGIESRFGPERLEILRITQAGPDAARGACFHKDEVEPAPATDCQLGAIHDGESDSPESEPRFDALLWGDSIANHYAGFFDEVGRAEGIRVRDITMGGCPPLLDTIRLERKKGPLCRERNDRVIELIRRSSFETVYIGGYWTSYLEPGGLLGDDIDMSLGRENSERVLRAALERTLRAIVEAGKTPVILRNVPRMDFDASTCAVKNAIHPARFAKSCRMDVARHRSQIAAIDAILLEAQQRTPALRFLSVTDLICPDQFCQAELDGTPLYKNANRSHLNMEGSRALGRAFIEKKRFLPGREIPTTPRTPASAR